MSEFSSKDEFGPDTDTIRAWLSKRATYAKDVRVPEPSVVAPTSPDPVPVDIPVDPLPEGTSARWEDVTPSQHSGAGAHRAGDGNSAARSIIDALRGNGAAPAPAPTPAPGASDAVGAKVAEREQAPTPVRTKPSTLRFAYSARTSPGAARAVPPEIRIGRWTEPADNLTSHYASTDVDFPARMGARHGLSLLLLAVLAGTGLAGYLAWQEPTTATVGIAATLGVLTLVVWAVRASVTTTQLSLHRGQLKIGRGGRTEIVDIGGGFTPVAILGRPGQRRWRVLIERGDMPLVTITPAMVDPHWFTTALYRIRPDLRPQGPRAAAGRAPEEDDDASVSQAS